MTTDNRIFLGFVKNVLYEARQDWVVVPVADDSVCGRLNTLCQLDHVFKLTQRNT